ncbi:hypothetical protein N9Y06_03940 [Flavobacteriales bacterium]|jgi:hypothetical protein|nr:hypothetical protein [Flavobacteriales bacterium]MDB2622435.1 hypothetical protein [Flavobacteriales bacterium]
MKKTILFLFLACTFGVNAQDFSFGADVQSRYVWRGAQLGGESASLQPSVEYTNGKLAVGAWAAYSLGGTNSAQEMDLYISYALTDAISVTVTDYYFPDASKTQDYLDLDADHTGHLYEASVSVAVTDAISLMAASNVGGTNEGETYIEASYAADQFSLFVGGVMGDDDGFYGTEEGDGLVNVGISLERDIQLSSTYSLPVNSSLVVNPDAGNVFLTFGFSL